MKEINFNRNWMKSNFKLFKEMETDQKKQVPQPPLQKPIQATCQTIPLPPVNENVISDTKLLEALKNRRSHRNFKDEYLTIEELSFLLWATQGVDKIKGENYATLRPVPSGGGRHPFETYLAVMQVGNLKKGIYRYLALTHELEFLFELDDMELMISEAALGQKFVGRCAVTFFWSCIPYRGEWRYDITAHKTMLLDIGHVCQNLYIACEAIKGGTCAIAAYDQEKADLMLKLDGDEEFVVYLAPVGKI